MAVHLDERQLRMTLDSVPIPMLAHDETGRMRFVNRELLRLTGYTREQLPTFRSWLELAYSDAELIERVLSSHRAHYGKEGGIIPYGGEYPVRIADGSRRLWRFQAFPIGRDLQNLGVNISMALDLTEERASTAALAVSENTLKQALRAAGVGAFTREPGSHARGYGDESLAMNGLNPQNRWETAERWLARVHPDDRDRAAAYLEQEDEPDAPTEFEFRIIRPSDGATRVLSERRLVQRDAAQKPVAIVGLQRDITDARAAEQALRDSEARLRLTLEIGEVGVFDWDLIENKLAWDERVRAIWGVAPHATLSIENFYQGLHPDDMPRLREAIGASHNPEGDGSYDAEFRVNNMRDGRIRNVSARGRTLFEGARPVRMMGVVVEVTALRQATAVLERDRAELERLVEARTRELAEAQTRLAQAQRLEALGQLAGGIAHDFNNVLQAIEAAADLIERRPDPQNLPRYLKMAREASKRGSAISRRLLSFSRRAELEPEPVETHRLLDEIAGVVRRTAGGGLAVRLDCASDAPPLLADRRQLETALLNVAVNAREAMNDAGEFVISARAETHAEAEASRYAVQLRPGAYVRIELRDTGHGMDAEVMARAVEPFFSTKPRGQGAGLGLSMARGFIQQSGGALRIESAPGEGATVAVWLPVAETAATMSHSQPGAANGRLLLVDDDPLVRELVAEQMRAAGFDVAVCSDGVEAIARLDGGLKVDLLLTDHAMPRMTGVELAREARKRMPKLPILILTGYLNEAAEAAGESDFTLVNKPIDSGALIRRVAAMIGLQATAV